MNNMKDDMKDGGILGVHLGDGEDLVLYKLAVDHEGKRVYWQRTDSEPDDITSEEIEKLNETFAENVEAIIEQSELQDYETPLVSAGDLSDSLQEYPDGSPRFDDYQGHTVECTDGEETGSMRVDEPPRRVW